MRFEIKIILNRIVPFFWILLLLLIISMFSNISYAKIDTNNGLNGITNSGIDIGYVALNGDVSQKMLDNGVVDVIIMMDDSSDSNAILGNRNDVKKNKNSKILTDKQVFSDKAIAKVSGFNKKYDLRIIDGYSGKLTRQGLQELQKQAKENYLNISIFENKPNHLLSTLNMSTETLGANYAWDALNITGRGIVVAIFDTGIDYTHPDLGNCTKASFLSGNCSKVIGGHNFAPFGDVNDPMDDNGHGTHVAGILAGNGSIKGVAPEAEILAVRVCYDNGDGFGGSAGCLNDDDIINAMTWAADQNVSIMSLSLGRYISTDPAGNSGKDPFSKAVDNFVDEGIVVVTSAGNSGPGASTIDTPAASEKAITVGAVDDFNTPDIYDDTVWINGSHGPSAFGRMDPELVAPGVNIISTFPGGYAIATGTSMAAPFVSGAAALLLEQNPAYSPSIVRAILMQSTRYIPGKVFEKGSGELDIQNALTGKLYAMINYTNPYNQNVINDRWEFVIMPYETSHANITIINNNDYDITLNPTIEPITNLENDITLDTSQLVIPSIITIPHKSNYTFQANFTLNDYNSSYATTYGGIINLNGSGYNGTADVVKNLRIPIVITIPISNVLYLSRQMYDNPTLCGPSCTNGNEDVYFYCYYNPLSKNTTVNINWSTSDYDLDLYLYNSTGDVDVYSQSSSTDYERLNTLKNDAFKWFRVDGNWFTDPPLTFNINITTLENTLPEILNVTPVGGVINGTDDGIPDILLFYRPDNITLNISYLDADNDSVNVTLNDSDFVLVATNGNTTNGSSAYSIFNKAYGSNLTNSTIMLTLTDSFGSSINKMLSIILQSSVKLNSYSPLNSIVYVKENNSIHFTVDAQDINNITDGYNKTLFYYWNINGTVVNQSLLSQNFTFDTSIYPDLSANASTLYVVSVLISNNDTSNESYRIVSWNVFVDGSSPIIDIIHPLPYNIYTQSKMYINYTSSDPSGVDSCWYSINGTTYTNDSVESNNISLSSAVIKCINTSIYLRNGNYTLIIYSNDTLGNSGYSDSTFEVEDVTSPNISNLSPSGSLSYTASVPLSVSTDENATCKFDTSNVSYNLMRYNFSDNITKHTVNSFAVSKGANNIFVRCGDMSNNTNDNSSIITFSISNPSSSGGGGSNGGNSGSGGSGGAGGFGGFISNTGTVSKTYGTLSNGITNMSVDDENIPVSGVSINSSENLTNVTITISRTDTPEMNYTIDESYAYIVLNNSIIQNNPDIQKNSSISTDIFFSVNKTWFNKSNTSIYEVVLMQYIPLNDSWDMLYTQYIDEDNDSAYYEAKGVGQGLFAISSNKSHNPTPIPVIKQPEINKSNSKNELLQVNSNPNSPNSGSYLGGFVNDAINGLKKQKDVLWIVCMLIGTFAFVIIVILLIKRNVIKQYENDFISETKKEFKDVNVLLSQKVPNIPETLREDIKIIDKAISGNAKQENIPRTREETIRIKNSEEHKKSENLAKDIAELKKSVEKDKKLLKGKR